jgi:alpha-galactosidase
MTLWAMSAAPLMMGHDVRTTSESAKRLLENRRVIAIDQDAKGVQGRAVHKDGATEIWLKPLATGAYAIALFNRGGAPATMTVTPDTTGLPKFEALRDVWSGATLGHNVTRFAVPAHGAVLLETISIRPSRAKS